VTTRLGASTDDLTINELAHDQSYRVISGSVLNGRTAVGHNAFLGRYHNQLSVIGDGDKSRLLGWLGLVMNRYTASSVFFRRKNHFIKRSFTTAQNGDFSAMLPVDTFERILPLDILPSPLLRALMVRDTDQAQALGCLELDEEDLALCSFVCPAKYDYGTVLRTNLDQIEKEG
jgi:Na+-transporting NADH:ubiquinone oxidoreductase subunit A